jgi:CubicO group peptidase (beta-lactamase class C family)
MLKTKGLISICMVLIILFSTLGLTGCGRESQSNYLEAQTIARSEVWKGINSGSACSASVAVMENGKIVYSEGFGMEDRENSISVTNKTLYNMGSISKVYCAAAIMLLVDAGKVSLDNPVTQYLAYFRMADPRYKDITVRMLLNHTSGLPGTTMANSFGFEENKDVFKDLLEALSTTHLKHAPGEMTIYCNDGFTLAEMVVEKISQKKYIDFLSEKIFAPLSLKNTGVSVGLKSSKAAAAYYQHGTTKKEPLEALSVLGAGGLSATTEDLCRFADTFSEKGKQILSKSSLDEMKKAQPSAFTGKLKQPSMSFGLGWDMTELPAYQSQGIKVLGKSGGTGNYSSMMYTVPEQRLSVAIIASGPGSEAAKIALDILDKVLVEKGLTTSHIRAVTKPLKPEKLPQELAAFAGYYVGDGTLYRLAVDEKENIVTVYEYQKGAESPMLSLFYNNGYLHCQSGKLYLTTVDGRDYLVSFSDLFNVDSIYMEKLPAIKFPQSLKIDVNEKQWLRRNVHSYEGTMYVPSHLIRSNTLEDLPGYVELLGIKSVQSPVFAGMPAFSGRDQTELTLFDKDGETWARVSDMVYSPAASARTFESGENTVLIGENGYNEWLKAGIGLVLSYEKPAKGRIIAFSTDGTCTYDSAVDTGDLYVPQGGFVEFAGAAGDVFKVTVTDLTQAEKQAIINKAISYQTEGGVYKADTYEVTKLKKGDIIYGMLPGQSVFYLDKASADFGKGSYKTLYALAQIRPHPIYGYRTKLGQYEVLEDMYVPCGMCLANNTITIDGKNEKLGEGGGFQYVIFDYESKLKLLEEKNLNE